SSATPASAAGPASTVATPASAASPATAATPASATTPVVAIAPDSAVAPASAVVRNGGGAPDFGVRHIGRRVETATERWQQEAQSVARLAAQIVSGTARWRVTDKGSPTARPVRFNDICVLIPTRTNLRGLERAFQR